MQEQGHRDFNLIQPPICPSSLKLDMTRDDRMSVFTQNVDDPTLCIVRTGRGERVSQELAGLLNPVDPATFHRFRLRANADVELHCHDVDEYWWFTEGNPKVTLRSPTGVVKEFALEPGDMVACEIGRAHV